MQDSKIYRHNAAMCRQLAKTMKKEDAALVLEMAAAWDARADEAELQQKSKNEREGSYSVQSSQEK